MRRVSRLRRSLLADWLTMTLSVVLLVAVLFAIIWADGRRRDRDEALASLVQSAQTVAIAADSFFDDGLTLGRTLSATSNVRSLDPQRFLPDFTQQVALHPQVHELAIIDRAGTVLGRTRSPESQPHESVGERAFLERVLRTERPTTIRASDPEHGAGIGTGVAVPIRADDGSIPAVLIVALNVEHFNEDLLSVQLSPGQSLALIDPNARVVTLVGDAAQRDGPLTWDQRDRSQVLEVHTALGGQLVTNADWRGPITSRARLAAFVPTPRHKWVVAATWAEEDALASATADGRHQILIFVAVLLITLVQGWAVARSVIFPIRRLTNHVERLGRGDFQEMPGESRVDELGRLARAFNEMGHRLGQSLKALSAERLHLEQVLDHLPVGVVVVSAPDGDVLRANALHNRYCQPPVGSTSAGPAEPPCMYRPTGQPFAPEERPLQRALRFGETVHGEQVLFHQDDGTDMLLHVNAAPIRDGNGRVTTVIQTCEDITDQARTSARVQQRDALLRTMFEQFPGAFTIIDRQMRVELAVAADRMEEFRGREVDGHTLSELFTPERAAVAEARVRRVLAGETLTLEHHAGDRIYSRIVCPLRDANGEISHALTLQFDVTEQRRTASRLRASDELVHALLDQFPAAISVIDRDYRVMMMGGQHLIAPDQPFDQIVGQLMGDFLSAEEFAGYQLAAAQAFSGETVAVNRVIGGRILHGTITPLRAADGTIDKVLNVAFDVTAEHAREERARRDEKLLALGQMAGGIAHDLNQALALVSGYGELAREALDGESPGIDSAQDMIRIMERAAYDGGVTVKRLLTFARGGDDEQFDLVDVHDLLTEVAQLTAPRWRSPTQAGGAHVGLQVRAASGLTMRGARSGLREMLTNLVFNSLDAMPDGGTITLSASQTGDTVTIEVADTGVGMPPEVRDRIFEPFFTTKGQAGTGLGLAMVFGIVQRHAGQIDVESEAGEGTTMRLRFPSVEAAPIEAADTDGPMNASAARILVVDDEEKLARLLVGLLKHDGHQGVCASSAEEALRLLHAEPFDLVISDISMGEGMNGWDLAAAVGALRRPIPVVLATGWGAAIDPAEARSRGVVAVMAKPYRRRDVLKAVAAALTQEPTDTA